MAEDPSREGGNPPKEFSVFIRKRWPWLAAAAVVLGVITWLAISGMTHGNGGWVRIRREGIIRIGYAVEAPYAFLDARGEPTGLEIEIASSVASRLAVPHIEWIQQDFAALIPGLEEGRFDAVAAGVFITPERAQRVSFSEPTFRVRQALLVAAGNPKGLHSYEEIARKEGIKIAVLHGSIEEALVHGMGFPEARVVVVPDARTGRAAVETGLADGLALSRPTVREMALREMLGLTEVAHTFTQPSPPGGRLIGFGAVVFRKTDDDLRRAWNRCLGGFVGSAEHLRLLSRYGLETEDLPGNVTTAAILASGTK